MKIHGVDYYFLHFPYRSFQKDEGSLWLHWISWSNRSFNLCGITIAWSLLSGCMGIQPHWHPMYHSTKAVWLVQILPLNTVKSECSLCAIILFCTCL